MAKQLSVTPDPDGPLARQAAEDVRAMFTARVGKQPDSLDQWNGETVRCVQPLIDRVIAELEAGKPEAAIAYMAEWVATYFGAFGLVANQMVQMAICRAYLELGHESGDDAALIEFGEKWHPLIMQTAFQQLVDDGRTIV